MTTPHYLTAMGFMLDVFSSMEQFSLISQTRHALLIDHAELRAKLIKTIRGFNRRNGIFLSLILEDGYCGPKIKECSLEEFEDHGSKFRGIELSHDSIIPHPTRLSVLRPLYIKDFVEVCYT